MSIPGLVIVPKVNPLQGKGPKQYANNGVPGKRDLMQQITGNGGGIQGHVIRKYVSDESLKKRKKVSAGLAVTTSTLGLSALGMKGASGVLRKVGRVNRNAGQLAMGRKLSGASNTTAIVSGGIGGVGGYNYASIQRAEAKRRKPVAKAFDAEGNRDRRSRQAEKAVRAGSNAASLGSAAGVVGLAARDLKVRNLTNRLNERNTITVPPRKERNPNRDRQGRNIKTDSGRNSYSTTKHAGYSLKAGRPNDLDRLRDIKNLRRVEKLPGLKSVKATAGLAGLATLGIGGTIGADRIRSYRNNSGKQHSPRYRPER